MHSQNPTPYRILDVNWNPAGHPPAAYAEPHFDFHFYTESEAEVMSWMPGMPGWENATRQPEERYRPQGFMADPSGASFAIWEPSERREAAQRRSTAGGPGTAASVRAPVYRAPPRARR